MTSKYKEFWSDAYMEGMEDLGLDSVDAEHYATDLAGQYIDHLRDRAKEDWLERNPPVAVKIKT